jgi:hypothetical protein
VSTSIKALAACILLATFGCRHRDADKCERALTRLDRISQTMTKLSAKQRDNTLEACRHGKYAASDPVVRCAMDADSDDAAASCIDKFVRTVVKPGTEGGSGINPLVDQAGQPTH